MNIVSYLLVLHLSLQTFCFINKWTMETKNLLTWKQTIWATRYFTRWKTNVTGNNYFYPAVSKHLNKLLNIKHERGIPSRAVSSVTTFMETMRQEGCKDGCFRTIVPTVTCAKAICLHHSINMEWGVKEHHVAVLALHNCGKSHSQIFELVKPLNECINWTNKEKIMTVLFPLSTFIYKGFRDKSVERK